MQVFEKRYTAEEDGSAVYASYKCGPVASCWTVGLPSKRLASTTAQASLEFSLGQPCK